MKTLLIYNVDGSSSESLCEDFEYDVFRKVLNAHDSSHNNELIIAKKLMEQPQMNVVKIYDVVQDDDACYIDMELLDDTYVPFTKYMTDIHDAVSQLHNLGVVYIDIKSDNVGFSIVDQKYKLFDFDCSGIINPQYPMKWLRKPFEGCRYGEVKDYEPNIKSLYHLDFISWELTYRRKF
jgi:serine/threonine protein kinase